MSDGGSPILPPSGGDPAQGALKAIELGKVEVTRVTAELKVLTQTARLEAQVIRINDNGTVTVQTPKGEVDIKPPVQLQPGQTVQIRVEAGNPPQAARLAVQPQASAPSTSTTNTPPPQVQGQVPTDVPAQQPQVNRPTPTTPQQQVTPTQNTNATNNTQAPAPVVPDTVVSPQASQRFDLPPVPLGTSVPTQFIPLPVPPSQTGIEVLLTTLFTGGQSLQTPSSSQQSTTTNPYPQASISPQAPLSSLAQIAQASLPPPIVEGIQNLQLLKTALTGRQFNPTQLLSNLYGTQPQTQILPVTGLPLPQNATSISPLTILPTAISKNTSVINVEKPITGVRSILASVIGQQPTPKGLNIQSQLNPSRIFFTQAPGKLIQVPNFPIATQLNTSASAATATNILNSTAFNIGQAGGIASPTITTAPSLFFGVTLGQTASADFLVLNTNGISIIPQQSVNRPLLPGTVIVAQSQFPPPPPNINLFNVPVINLDGSFLNFDPIFGDGWPVLDEVLHVLQQVDPAYAGAVRSSIPNVSTPTQLPSSILFFMAATGMGDVRAWVGDRMFEALSQAGRSELSTLLGNDFSAIATRAAEQTPDGWRPFMVPMIFGEELYRMQFFTRQQQGDETDGQTGGKQTRFLLNVEKTKLGPIQLDGLINPQRLDMVLRSDDLLEQDMRQGIRQHFANALNETGLDGAITFEHGDQKWVEVDTLSPVEESVFI